jgi:prephenate dehydratase
MSGYFGKDFSLDEKELESIADYLMGVSEKTDDYYSMLDKLNNYMEKKYGISMKEEEEDTAKSAEMIKKKSLRGHAAICSKAAAEIHLPTSIFQHPSSFKKFPKNLYYYY